jgi:ParB family transcriptional regulator, chromosome partitioning protein
MKIATSDDVKTNPPAPAPSGEFQNVSLNAITVGSQVRSEVLTNDDDFKALLESIRREGVIEPIILTRQNSQLKLIAGERRLRACQILGLTEIPARILENADAEKTLRLQLMENLLREELNPLDETSAYIKYFCLQRGERSLDEICGVFDNLALDPLRVTTEDSQTATAIMTIAGKSLISLRRLFSLPKLPAEIQDALRYDKISVSQAYIFAGELDNPGLTSVFKLALEKPLSNETLKRLLNEARRAQSGTTTVVKADKLADYRRSFKQIRVSIQSQKARLTTEQADILLADVRELLSILEECRAEASQAAPGAPVTESKMSSN